MIGAPLVGSMSFVVLILRNQIPIIVGSKLATETLDNFWKYLLSYLTPDISLQYLDVLTAGSKSVRFFLPLCGKAGDLLHLYNEGHTVTGVEGVPFVVEQFFRENKLDYEKVSLPEIRGWKYKVSRPIS